MAQVTIPPHAHSLLLITIGNMSCPNPDRHDQGCTLLSGLRTMRLILMETVTLKLVQQTCLRFHSRKVCLLQMFPVFQHTIEWSPNKRSSRAHLKVISLQSQPTSTNTLHFISRHTSPTNHNPQIPGTTPKPTHLQTTNKPHWTKATIILTPPTMQHTHPTRCHVPTCTTSSRPTHFSRLSTTRCTRTARPTRRSFTRTRWRRRRRKMDPYSPRVSRSR